MNKENGIPFYINKKTVGLMLLLNLIIIVMLNVGIAPKFYSPTGNNIIFLIILNILLLEPLIRLLYKFFQKDPWITITDEGVYLYDYGFISWHEIDQIKFKLNTIMIHIKPEYRSDIINRQSSWSMRLILSIKTMGNNMIALYPFLKNKTEAFETMNAYFEHYKKDNSRSINKQENDIE